jgi:hypothetical protein
MQSSNNGTEAQSGKHAQRWVVPKWLDALGLIYVFFISIPAIFNSILIGIDHGRATEAQQILNTSFIASNLLVSLCVLAYLPPALLFNRMTLRLWRVLPLSMLSAAYGIGVAYDSLAHLVPNISLPLLVEVATRLAPGPMAILGDMSPIIELGLIILLIVIMVRGSAHSKRLADG